MKKAFFILIMIVFLFGCTSVTVKNLRYSDKTKGVSLSMEAAYFYNMEKIDFLPIPMPSVPQEK